MRRGPPGPYYDSGIGPPRIEPEVEALPIFKLDRASALYHLAVALEMSTHPHTVNPDLVMAMGRRVLEASMRAIPGIYRNCTRISRRQLSSSTPQFSRKPRG